MKKGISALLAIPLALSLASACRESSPGEMPSLSPAQSAAPASSVAADMNRANAPRIADAGSATDADPVVDLLHVVDATVAVSSKVDNPHDYPEHLVDGKMDTAWNSRTGDLNGSISFRVPKTARVLKIELTSGFDKIGKEGDLFTLNHRITKVRLEREGAILKELSLDPARRDLQAIDLDEPGGDFKLTVLETLPGAKKAWKELVVSEFRVWGRAGGAPPNPSHIPKMAIGSLDGVRPTPPRKNTEPRLGPFPSIAAMCKNFDQVMTPQMDAVHTDNTYPGRIAGPHCEPASAATYFGKAATQTFSAGNLSTAGWVIVNEINTQEMRMVLKTDQGYSLTPITMWSRWHDDPGCLHTGGSIFEDANAVKTATGRDVLIVRVVHQDTYWMQYDPKAQGTKTVEISYSCSATENGAVTCDGPLTSGFAHEDLPDNFDPSRSININVDKIPWRFRKEPILGPAGDLRLASPEVVSP